MPLPSVAPISMSQVNDELGYPSTQQISLNDAAVRSLFARPSGEIALLDGLGKSSVPSVLIGHTHSGSYGGYSFAVFGGSGTISFTGNKSVQALLVGGGGAGGSAGGGGGGGGGFLETTIAMSADTPHSIIIGGGGVAVDPPITGVPTAGNATYIFRIAGSVIVATVGGGGYGGTRNSSYRNGGPNNGDFAGGGGGAAYAGAVAIMASGGGGGGGNGVLYYGGGGGGSRTAGSNGKTLPTPAANTGGWGGFGWSYPHTGSGKPQWTTTISGAVQTLHLSGGGGGSGWNNSNAGQGGPAGAGYQVTSSGSGARWQNKDNVWQYWGQNGLRTTNENHPTQTNFYAGVGGGGGAYSTANGTAGQPNYRLGGNGGAGLVVLRWLP